MPLIYAHLIPATMEGRARMNIANALAAAGAAWAAGAHLHDIRQGLRTFSTSFFQAPGRLNEVDVRGFKVIIDYCHNVDGMRRLTEFVDLTMSGPGPVRGRRATASGRSATAAANGHGNGASAPRTSRAIGVIGIPGDRRDEDQREYGALAARSFDEIIVREDKNLRGRKPGETAEHVLEGIREAQADGARAQKAEAILDELEAAKVAHAPRPAGRPRCHLRRRLDGRLPRGHGPRSRGRCRQGHRRPGRAARRRRLSMCGRANRRRRA